RHSRQLAETQPRLPEGRTLCQRRALHLPRPDRRIRRESEEIGGCSERLRQSCLLEHGIRRERRFTRRSRSATNADPQYATSKRSGLAESIEGLARTSSSTFSGNGASR